MEGERLITNRAPSEVGVHTNMFGQLMLGGISGNLKSPSTVTVKRSGGGDWRTKILQEPTEPDNLLNSRSQGTELSLDIGMRKVVYFLVFQTTREEPRNIQ